MENTFVGSDGKRTCYQVENVDWTGSFLSINLDRMVSRKQQWHKQRAVQERELFCNKEVYQKTVL